MTTIPTPPAGEFRGYERNSLQSLAPDDELTRVGPGQPCGEYLRRFWHPIALTSMVGELPLRVRRLGEDLVLFRDKSGRYGLLHLLCSHRNASLEYGVPTERGLRCCYHGWLFDVDGTILETPGEPASSKIAGRTCHGAYPVIEHRGMIFAYFGAPDRMPPFPWFDTLDLPDDTIVPYMVPSPCNWVQIFENGADPYHVSFLHSLMNRVQFQANLVALPTVDYHERAAGNGMFYTSTRRVGEFLWFRVHDHMLPNFSQNGGMHVEGDASTYFVRTGLTRWVVPVDDENAITIAWRHFNAETDPKGKGRPELCGYNSVDFYGQTGDRPYEQMQRDPGDWEAWTSQGPRTVHKRERLGSTDRGVVLFRRRLRNAIQAHARGDAILLPTDKVTTPVPTYGGDTVLRARRSNSETSDTISAVSKKVADVYRSGDHLTGEDRTEFIRDGLRMLEAELQ
ncbi:MAG: Rieske 2Fe-2S domain-containing protein [Pseudomonadota bacterium]|nr:Rieske 2Fe-2S domain-containing protein [Pseudomonadota bacterium]